MSELRIFRKSDGTEVLQYEVELPPTSSPLGPVRNFEWKDVPVVCEVLNPLSTGKIQSVSGCAGGECGKNGSEFEFIVTHRLSEEHLSSWSDHDYIVNDAFTEFRMVIRHAKILSIENGFSKVKYLVHPYGADPHSYISKEMFSNYPCLSLYDQEYINSKRKKSEVVSFTYLSTLRDGLLKIKHFRKKEGEFDQWKPGQVIYNTKSIQKSTMIIREANVFISSGMYKIVSYSVEAISASDIPIEYVKEGEEFKSYGLKQPTENIIGSCERSISVPSDNEKPKVEDNEVMEFGQFILDKIKGLHCRNVKGWHNDFINSMISKKL